MAGIVGRSTFSACNSNILQNLENVVCSWVRRQPSRSASFLTCLSDATGATFSKQCSTSQRNVESGGSWRKYSSALEQIDEEFVQAKPQMEGLKPGEELVERVQIGKREILWRTGKLARLADAACVCSLDSTTVLATVVCDRSEIQQLDMVPLQVEYREKQSAVGRFPQTFNRRDGPAKEHEIVTMRAIDRAIRPLFPADFGHEIQLIANVLAADGTRDPDIVAINATSAALMLSSIPWQGPVGAVRIGYVDDEYIINPSVTQLANAEMNLTFAGTSDRVVMIECQGNEVEDAVFAEGLRLAQLEVKRLTRSQEKLVARVGRKKQNFVSAAPDPVLVSRVMEIAEPLMKTMFHVHGDNKEERSKARNLVAKKVKETLNATVPAKESAKDGVPGSGGLSPFDLEASLSVVEAKVIREMILQNGTRVDGREVTDLRSIYSEVECLPIVHGSGLFQRGETQSLCTATIGGDQDVQEVQSILGELRKHLMVHYGFPPFATCEVSKVGGISRREIGHGNLAERALSSVMPELETFPFPVKITAETLSSNGSSSMAAVCGGALALKDAGVPIKGLVAGVSIGLVTGTPSKGAKNGPRDQEGMASTLLVDLQGLEDHHGDMDFKIAGTARGITAAQLDVKLPGIGLHILQEALPLAASARAEILRCMEDSLPQSNTRSSPRFGTIEVHKDLMGHVIGEGGETIRRIESDSGARIIVRPDSNEVRVYAPTSAQYNLAETAILDVQGANIREGEVYTVRVVRIMDFGAFVELPSGFQTLLHISELSHARIRAIEEVVFEGQELKVKCLGRDHKGNIRISRKALQPMHNAASS